MEKRLRHLIAIVLLGLTASCSSSPLSPWELKSDNPAIREKQIRYLGGRFQIRLWLAPGDKRNPEALFQTVITELRRVLRVVDADNPASEMAKVNRTAFGSATTVTPELGSLLALSLKLHYRSGGVFDITFAPIQEENEKNGPDAGLGGEDLEFASNAKKGGHEKVGSGTWSYDPATRQVRFLKSGIKLVIKGLASGHAAQKAAEKLSAIKLQGFAVIGGGVLVAGGSALKDPNLMCIEDPKHLGSCLYRVIPTYPEKLFAMSMAASVDRPGHVYNPKSGARSFLEGGATLVGPDGAWAQGSAVAISMMEERKLGGLFDKTADPRLGGIYFDSTQAEAIHGDFEPYAKIVRVSKAN